MSTSELSILFFLQFAIILTAVKIVGRLAQRIGQPPVIGEIVAGVLLGPTLLGALAPELQARLFPPESIPIIYAVSQLGIVLFMFLVGVEFDIDLIRTRKKRSAFISLAGIVTPFILGGLLALYMMGEPGVFTPEVSPLEAFLFLGSAMSITAFPILARMIQERGLSKTPLGTLVLAAGSIDDAAAWCLLAIVLASFGDNAMVAIAAIGGGALYALAVLFVIRPGLKRYLDPIVRKRGEMTGTVFTMILILVMLGAWITDVIGIYAVFGAFILGVAMPRGLVSRELHRKIHPIAAYILLPLFFIFSGLQTQFGLITGANTIRLAVLVLVVAILGKGVACWAAARLSGEGKKESILIGAFMNARGLMELILLNIGIERGLVTPTLFAVMVLMTLITTMMVGPIFEYTMRRSPELSYYKPLAAPIVSED